MPKNNVAPLKINDWKWKLVSGSSSMYLYYTPLRIQLYVGVRLYQWGHQNWKISHIGNKSAPLVRSLNIAQCAIYATYEHRSFIICDVCATHAAEYSSPLTLSLQSRTVCWKKTFFQGVRFTVAMRWLSCLATCPKWVLRILIEPL